MIFKIEKNVPITKQSVYPFRQMNVGDSFSVNREIINKVRNAARSFGNYHNMKFVTRKTADGTYRIWRVK